MSKGLRVLLRLLLWMCVIAYISVAVVYHNRVTTTDNLCTGLKINILDDQHFVDESIVRNWVDSLRLDIVGKPVSEIPLSMIENFIKDKPYVYSVDVSSNVNGECIIDLTQRSVAYRVVSEKGYDFYVDTTMNILNPSGVWFKDVPVITTDWDFPFSINDYGNLASYFTETDTYFLKILRNFVNIVSEDSFLSNLITQIRLTGPKIPGKEEIRLVPRVGKQIIVFGSLDDFREKLDRLKFFYKKTFDHGWVLDSREVCFQYGNKIVLKRELKDTVGK